MATLSSISEKVIAFGYGSQTDKNAVSGIAASVSGILVYSYEELPPYALDSLTNVSAPGIRYIVKAGQFFVGVGDGGVCFQCSTTDPDGFYSTSNAATTANLKHAVVYGAVIVAVGDGDTVVRSADYGSTWAEITLSSNATTFYGVASDGAGNMLVVGSSGAVWLSADSGATFAQKSLSITVDLLSCSHAGSNWVISGEGGYLAYLNAAATTVTTIDSETLEDINVVLNNKIVAGGAGYTAVIDTDLGGVTETSSSRSDSIVSGSYASDIDIYFVVTSAGAILYTSGGIAVGDWGNFVPLSDIYRSNDYAVLNGYSILIGTLEYSATDGWQYNSRRLRWTSPGTLRDFTSTGAGTGDLNGRGNLICGAVVNERLVLFESESISAIVPTGIVEDPWNYEKIHEGLWSLSNPVTANDKVYFVASDGLIYATNGITVSAIEAGFDLTEYTDFDRETTVVLAYSSELQSLLVFVPPASSSDDRSLHIVNTETGAYSTFYLPMFTLSATDYLPKMVVARNDNYLSTVMVAYAKAAATSTADLLTVEFDFDGTGLQDSLSTDTDNYFLDIQTGEIDLIEEASKASVKHVILDVYTDIATAGEVAILVKSSEDSAWHSANDFNGTFSITGTALTVTGSALSNKIASAGESGTAGAFTLPCLASQARVYVGSALQTLDTNYTITGTKEITMASVPLAGILYAYWENEPEIRAEANDLFEDSAGNMHRLVSVTDWNTGVVTPGTGAATLSATHIPAETISTVGSSEVKIGMNKLCDGMQIRVVVVPRADTAGTLKVTGLGVGYLPTSALRRVS